MGRGNILRNNFTAGEMSERLQTRAGLVAYENGCFAIENMILHKEGGLAKRPGFRFVAALKGDSKRVRLINFRFSVSQTYIIEAGDGYFRFYADGGQIVLDGAPYEVASTYTEQQCQELTWTQSADFLYLFHAAHPPRALRRAGHTDWTLSDVVFSPPMTYEAGHQIGRILQLSATTGTVTAVLVGGPGPLLAADVDRLVEAKGGQATITAVTSPDTATLVVNRPFPRTTFVPTEWTLVGSPVAALTPNKKEPIGAVVTLTLDIAGWLSEDIGKYVDVAGGFVELTGYTSPTVMTGIIRGTLSATTQVGAGGWKLRTASWSVDRGYPAAGGFHQQRFCFGGVPADPGRIVGSRSADLYAFPLGTKDDDAIEYPLLDDDVHAIHWIRSFGDKLAIGTNAAAWVVSSGITDPTITPTAIAASLEQPYGAAPCMPARRIGGSLVYVHRSRKSLMALRYDFGSDSYGAQDLNVLATHILRPGIVDWSFQQEREPILWVVRGDGQLAACTWYPEHEVMGWHRHITAGSVESVAVIPGDPDDELWAVIRRTIGGRTRRFVERLDPLQDDDDADGLYLDAGLTYMGDPATTISGLDHLEGETVAVRADGMVLAPRTVVGGTIMLSHPAEVVQVGLPYEAMFRPSIPDVGVGDGSTAGRRRRIIRVTADGLRATQCWVGPDEDHLVLLDGVTTRRLDQPAETFTGQRRTLPQNSYDDEYNLMFVHKLPNAFRIRALAVLIEASQA